MVKLGDTVKWENTRTKEKLSGKIIGGEKGKNWKIEKGGKKYFVAKDRVKMAKKVLKKKTAPKKAVAKKPAPKKKSVDKDSFLDVLSVMGEVAKSKGKSTKKEVDSKVAIDKKAEKGKLTQKAFLEDVVYQDGYDEENDNIYENYVESGMYNAPDNMTETQQQRFFERTSNRAYRDVERFRKALFKKLIKGKKFKSFKDASKVFISNMSKYHPDLDV